MEQTERSPLSFMPTTFASIIAFFPGRSIFVLPRLLRQSAIHKTAQNNSTRSRKYWTLFLNFMQTSFASIIKITKDSESNGTEDLWTCERAKKDAVAWTIPAKTQYQKMRKSSTPHPRPTETQRPPTA